MELSDLQKIRKSNFVFLVKEIGGQTATSAKLDMSKSLVSRYANGTKGIGEKLARKIEKSAKKYEGFLDTTPPLVLQDNGTSNVRKVTDPIGTSLLPLISWATAGEWHTVSDPEAPGIAEDWIPAHLEHGANSYWLRVVGDSMWSPNGSRPSYHSNDLILIDPDQADKAANESPIIARFTDRSIDPNHRTTFRKLIVDGSTRYLAPINTSIYKPIYDDFEIIGLVLGGFY